MISLWWDILKNAKISGKTTSKVGGSLKDGDVKISFDEDDCKNKLKKFNLTAVKIYEKNTSSNTSHVERQTILHTYSNNIKLIDKLPEEVACEAVKQIEAINLDYLPSNIGDRGDYYDSVKPLIDGWNIGIYLTDSRGSSGILGSLFNFSCQIFKKGRYSGIKISTGMKSKTQKIKGAFLDDIDWRK